MIKEKSRLRLNLSSFSLIKGFAMIILVIGHMNTTVSWETEPLLGIIFWNIRALRAGIIPAFLMITGFGFKEKSPQKMLKQTFSELIVPYLFVTLAYAVVYPIVVYLRVGSLIDAVYDTCRMLLSFVFGIPEVGKSLFGFNLYWCAAAWYLLALFGAMNGLNLILKVKNQIVQALLAILCTAVGYLLIARDINYFCIPQALMSIAYCYIGYQFKRHKIVERFYNKVWVYLLLVPIVLAQIIWGYFDLCSGTFNNIFLDYFAAGCFGILLLFLGVSIGQSQWKGLDWMKEVGVYSYWILCIHSFEMQCFPWDNLRYIFPDHQILVFFCQIVVRALLLAGGCACLKTITKYIYKRRIQNNGRKRLL